MSLVKQLLPPLLLFSVSCYLFSVSCYLFSVVSLCLSVSCYLFSVVSFCLLCLSVSCYLFSVVSFCLLCLSVSCYLFSVVSFCLLCLSVSCKAKKLKHRGTYQTCRRRPTEKVTPVLVQTWQYKSHCRVQQSELLTFPLPSKDFTYYGESNRSEHA